MKSCGRKAVHESVPELRQDFVESIHLWPVYTAIAHAPTVIFQNLQPLSGIHWVSSCTGDFGANYICLHAQTTTAFVLVSRQPIAIRSAIIALCKSVMVAMIYLPLGMLCTIKKTAENFTAQAIGCLARHIFVATSSWAAVFSFCAVRVLHKAAGIWKMRKAHLHSAWFLLSKVNFHK